MSTSSAIVWFQPISICGGPATGRMWTQKSKTKPVPMRRSDVLPNGPTNAWAGDVTHRLRGSQIKGAIVEGPTYEGPPCEIWQGRLVGPSSAA